MTFRRILVGLDDSFQSPTVFARALEQAKPHCTSILLMQAIPFESCTEPPAHLSVRSRSETGDMYETLKRMQQRRVEHDMHDAQVQLQTYYQQTISRGIPAFTDCRVGDPGVLICARAEQWGADLIVLGHREYHGLRDAAANSVCQYVMQHAPCSVLIVQGVGAAPVESMESSASADRLAEAGPPKKSSVHTNKATRKDGWWSRSSGRSDHADSISPR